MFFLTILLNLESAPKVIRPGDVNSGVQMLRHDPQDTHTHTHTCENLKILPLKAYCNNIFIRNYIVTTSCQ